MATLTATTVNLKKLLRLVGITLGAILAIFILFRIGGSLKNLIYPEPPVGELVAFGKLTKLDLSEGIQPLDGTRFTVETISGDISDLENQAKVFEIAKPQAEFGVLERAKASAQRLGFNPQPIEISQGVAKFVDTRDESRILTVDTVNGTITLDSDYLRNPSVISSKLKTQIDARSAVVSFFDGLDLPIEKYSESQITFENFKIENGMLEAALSLSASNLVKVIFEKDSINEMPIVNINSEDPLIWGLAIERQVVAANYTFNDIKLHKFSTYPLKGAKKAYEELTRGEGVLNKSSTSNVFAVRNVKLGYVESKKYQPYLQPVYIFESDDDFLAFVEAVSENWVVKE